VSFACRRPPPHCTAIFSVEERSHSVVLANSNPEKVSLHFRIVNTSENL
jgi:hypothetical protein